MAQWLASSGFTAGVEPLQYATLDLAVVTLDTVTGDAAILDVPGPCGSSGALLGGGIVGRIAADDEAAERDSAISG